jgi:hypothetical protein
LSIIERTLFPERPEFYISASMRGGGKTTAIKMVVMAALGIAPSAAAWSDNEEERRKSLFSYLREGVSYVLWDNLRAGEQVDCSHLQRAATSETISDRVLGASEGETVPSTAVQIFTGNNIGPGGENLSRALRVHLDVNRLDPENRPFRHSEPGWTQANRAKILRALYTILLGNPALKMPRNADGKTRFKLWWRVVGAAVENAARLHAEATDPDLYGADDTSRPVAVDFERVFTESEASDEDSLEHGRVLNILNRRWPVSKFKAADVATLVEDKSAVGAAVREFLFEDYKADQAVTAKAVGKRLLKHVGKPAPHDGKVWVLRSAPNRDKVAEYWVVELLCDNT